MDIPANEIHLYLLRGLDQSVLWTDEYEAILDAEERSRAAAFKIEPPRQTYRMAHLLLRFVLSQYASIPPADWQFVCNDYGRPEIAQGILNKPSRLRFNLSHTQGCIACAVVNELSIGVDAERHRPLSNLIDLANRTLTPIEVRKVFATDCILEQEQRFFAYWSLKEAYIKGRGMGFALPLQKFAFTWDRDDRHRLHLHLDPSLQDAATDWQFVLFHLRDRASLLVESAVHSLAHSLSIGVCRGDRPDLAIRIYDVVRPKTETRIAGQCLGSTGDNPAIFWEPPIHLFWNNCHQTDRP